MQVLKACERDYVWNASICSCENREYLASIIDDSKLNVMKL